jgi:ribosomal protein S18 acetylase RimI-like enzyme
LGKDGLTALAFRDATRADLPLILELFAATWQRHKKHDPDSFNDDDWTREVQQLHAQFEPGRRDVLPPVTLIAEMAGHFVGYASAVRHFDAQATGPHEVAAHIVDVAVLPDQRQSGVGGQLITQLKDRLRAEGTTVITATVWSFNTDSEAMLERAGLSRQNSLFRERLSPPHDAAPPHTTAPAPPTDASATTGNSVLAAVIFLVILLALSR